MSFMEPKRTLGAKIEGTPYTSETLSANDYKFAAYEVNYSGDIPMKGRKLVRADFSRDVSVAGKRAVTITFKVDLYHSGAVATPPNYFELLRACGLKQTVHGATGVSLITHADYTNVPMTMEVVEKGEGTTPSQVVIKMRGGMGKATIEIANVGEPATISFEFLGILESITDRAFASILAPSGISTQVPDAVLSSGMTLFGEAQCFNTLTIDLGNDVQLHTCSGEAEGYKGAHLADRNPTIKLDPDLELIATQGDYARWTGNTTGALNITIGTLGRKITLTAPAAQYVNAYQPSDREGHVVNQKSLELKRSSGNDEFEIIHGTK